MTRTPYRARSSAERFGRVVYWWLHNLVAHPLLVVWPSAGERLHAWTGKRLEEC